MVHGQDEKRISAFFENVSKHQLENTIKSFRKKGISTRAEGSGRPPVEEKLKDKFRNFSFQTKPREEFTIPLGKWRKLSVSPSRQSPTLPKEASSNVSRKVKAQILKPVHKEKRLQRVGNLRKRLQYDKWRCVW